ncbi:mitotic exit network interactor 1 [Blastomyces gilchristii SLH14081]|uniref:protein-histidine N-methyltransferase n=1 Tax=Blastomyces gilchristii (strain SLH14081) TaxID=559298 RepID=A0A179ULZ0_BLAGS|nr:mitotic exit network interactor 1 [Blastomyces gilchristii SLH14081]OAT08248.1 mitotic exit network interactor 1 [Blastomyces gilchristii SLH14081]
MSTFTFGFGGDDIDDQDAENDQGPDDTGIDAGIRQLDIAGTKTGGEGAEGEESVLVEASYCDLDEMLSTLPSQISYNMLPINPQSPSSEGPSLTIPRREVFDIRAQLMAEDDADTNENAELISGLEKGDLKPTVYEGGLKTWECAIDLAKLVAAEEIPSLLSDTAEGGSEDIDIIELGAGTAIPSLAILHHLLSRPVPRSLPRRIIRFVFADYNAAVLRLVTVPNILLTWQTCRRHHLDHSQQRQRQQQQPEGNIHPNIDHGTDAEHNLNRNRWDGGRADDDEQPDLDIEPALLSAFREDLHARGICLSFISGAWSPAFVDLALPNRLQSSPSSPSSSPSSQPRRTNLLVLASETIYSPTSLLPFSETLLALLRRGGRFGVTFTGTSTSALPLDPAAGSAGVTNKTPLPKYNSKALIAAKEVYFGVGGGVDEFLNVMRDVGRSKGRVSDDDDDDGFSVKERAEIRNEGVGRLVLEVIV